MILLGGSTKKRQQQAIQIAWQANTRCARLRGDKSTRSMGIALTRHFKETVVARVRRHPKFKQALFTEGAREAARHGKGGVKEALLTLGPLRAVERRIILLLIPASEEGKSDFDLPPVRAAE